MSLMGPMSKTSYYITAHGYGHGVRSCDIIRALRELHAQHEVVVVSDLPESFLRSRLPAAGVTFRRAAFDLGMVQLDSIRVDVPETLRQVRALFAERKQRIADESHWLEANHIKLVVADIPSLPFEAAARAGIPRVAVGNFAWDWIYEEFIGRDAGWRDMVEIIRHGYAQADLLIRLPFAEEMTAFPRRVDVPLVSRPGRARRTELARRFGCDPGKSWVLLSFTTLDWDESALHRVAGLRDHVLFTVKPLEWHAPNLVAVDRTEFSFADVLASSDVVVTKPGYGILSDCVVNDKPIVYADRTDFREYPVLVDGMRRHLRSVHIPAEELYRGELAPSLEAALRAPPPLEPLAAGGDAVVADLLAERRA